MQSAGFLEELLKIAEQLGCIDAQRLSVDGFFPEDAEEESLLIMGTKSRDEKEQAIPLLSKVVPFIKKVWNQGKAPNT
ncbi:hypothetical protein RHT_00630 [Candidatus Rhabdochlamydia sp. T3358]|nr:hypothetical protein RHT_00630 [Candidatus Rhabdochlamydia sp. T3358]